ncbi:MAG TPA: ATP-dependent 6-phosphofructokinase [bacterium]|uniref:ATP-dependent 6-phosphofructokinase n=1 Tax=candidate division TA06 bacterium ADurb.Bin417 TaxID=1852828 RepID=A0A1V5MJA0_UNCT6|nr:MAG: 6-phosphofructokinase isozyme 1 [candidate division TA06 bacterium ADurb.Bin417]HNQ35039.1 ATP-dependent 6-phosphofructokinase [bacterium]HNS48198.1 ATP-dependent 6-phosphofructokinase [bacterium]
MTKTRRIGLLTTGGDAPGMNPAIRAVVRRALAFGWEVVGIERGFQGLYEKDFREMGHGSVSGIINLGGTVLKTIRCPGFRKADFRRACYRNLEQRGIGSLVVIGGDGSLAASQTLVAEWKHPLAFIPASIDNDISGTTETIGFDTAVNTALEAIDRIRDTATSHERIFLVEVMGREKGFLALEVGLAAGAEAILVPEVPFDLEAIRELLLADRAKGKRSMIMVVAEGAVEVAQLAPRIAEFYPGEVRYSVLGYIQRGGAPSARSRCLALRFGARAVEALAEGRQAVCVGLEKEKVVVVDLKKARKRLKLDRAAYRLAHVLSA